MPTNIDSLLALLLDVSIKAALLAGIAGGLLFVLRVQNANLQHRVWSAVLVAMLALPLLICVVPRVSVPIVKYANVAAWQRPEVVPVVTWAPATQHSMGPVAADKSVGSIAMPMPALAHAIGPAVEAPAAPAVTAPSIGWPWIIAVAYLVGLGWFGMRLFIGLWRARQLLMLAQQIAPRNQGAMPTALRGHAKKVAKAWPLRAVAMAPGGSLAAQTSIIRPARSSELPAKQQQIVGATRVQESSLVRVPLTVGWWRPTIVLPSDWRSWDESLLTTVLSHEQEHVRRGDPLMALLAEVNRTIYWFHPVAWFLRRRLSTLAEAACDDAVVASLDDRAGYARHLLTVAGRLTGESQRLVPAGVAMARTPRVERRINAVLDASRPLARRLSIATSLAIAVIAVSLAILAAGLKASEESAITAPTPTPTLKAPSTTGETDRPRPSIVPKNEPESTLLSAGPIRELKSKNGGRTFEFPINVPKARKFGISFGEWPISGPAPVYSLREKDTDGPTTATLRMEYTSESKAKQQGDVLLSSDEWMEFRLNVPGAYPTGIVHVAGVPLRKVPPAERKVIFIPSDSPLAKAKTGIRLMLIVRKDQNPKTAEDVEKIEPRGELIVSLAPVDKPKPEPTPQQQLADAWHQAESGVGTFFVRYQHLVGSRSWFKPLDAETVRKIVHDAAAKHLKPDYGSSDADAEQSHGFVAEILRATLDDVQLQLLDGKPIKLAQNDFRMVGAKTLNIEGTRPGETPWSYRLFDGDVDLRYDTTNRQLNVLKAGQSHVARNTLGDFRALMGALNFRLNDFDKALADSQVKTLLNGRVLLSLGPLEIVANPQNGFVERFLFGLGQNVEHEILQFGPKEFPGKQTFPRSKLDFEYQDGKLNSLSVYTSDELRVNEGFSDSDFTLKLPAGVTVVDYRVSESRPDSFKVDAEIPDAVEFAKTHLGRKPVTKTPNE